MKILDEYRNSHHYWTEYEKTEWYCPNCGKQEFWQEQSPGDYYVGSSGVCVVCGHETNLLGGPFKVKEQNKLDILQQLKEQKTFKPTTPKGN